MRKPKRPYSPPTEHTEHYYCLTCDSKDQMTRAEIAAHLKTVHKLKSLRAKVSLEVALDGDCYYTNIYTLTLAKGVKVQRATSGPAGAWKVRVTYQTVPEERQRQIRKQLAQVSAESIIRQKKKP
jgi:hypothetical protein